MMSQTILSVFDAKKTYGKKHNQTTALKNVSFKVEKGEFIAIMGPSGSGKTTLLNCISTIDSLTDGAITINKKDTTSLSKKELQAFRRDELGFIFQHFNLLDTLTAYDNIALSLSIQNGDPKEIPLKVKGIAQLLEIEDILNKFPYEMSGGQQQRVSAARALVGSPSLVLADEPTGALDSHASAQLLGKLKSLNQSLDATILMVTHDALSASYADRILFISDGSIMGEIYRKDESQKEFFTRIMEIVSEWSDDNDL